VSLINDVLRDLHAQPNGSEDEFDSAFEGLEAPPLRPVHSGEGRSILGRIVLGTFLGIMGLFVWESGGARELLLGSDQKRGTSHPSEAALIVLAPEPVVTPEPHAADGGRAGASPSSAGRAPPQPRAWVRARPR
jgi:hypothetical protein